MNRRRFFHYLPCGLLAATAAPTAFAKAATTGPMDRLGMTSVVFMNRFAQTRPKNLPLTTDLLTLHDIPAYYADRFHLHNIEFWSRHFESRDPAYLKELSKTVRKNHATLINIQLDGPYDLSATVEAKRLKSVQFVKEWIDTAHTVRSKGLRANAGGYSVEQSIASFNELARYAGKKGITLYLENHGGFTKDPRKVVNIYKSVNPSSLKVLTDFGNFDDSMDRIDGVRMLAPFTGLVSAKAFHVTPDGQHPDFDFSACVRACEDNGFTGIYSAEYYDPKKRNADPEKVADWILGRLKTILSAN